MKLPQIISVHGAAPGLHLVVTGAIHGNEKCGQKAIDRVLALIKSGDIEITAGHVSFVPVSNPLAWERGVRFVMRNLNRFLFPKEKPETYEDHVGNVLCGLFRKADRLLDLHSFTAPGEAFVMLGPPRKEEAEFAKALGINNFAHGWQDSYKDKTVKDPLESQGTTEYTRLSGALAVTVECGSHNDPESVEVAFQAILNALRHYKLARIDPALFDPRPVSKGPEQCVRLTDVFYKTEEGRFAKPWGNMSPVKKGELLAVFNSGKTITAPEDGFVIMPVENEKVGAEWFHFGVKSDYFAKLGIK